MSWCPICKCEYVAGIKMCADCKVELVDELEPKMAMGAREIPSPMGINIDTFEMIEPQSEDIEGNQDDEYNWNNEEQSEKVKVELASAYVDSDSIAKENKSSAAALLFTGFLGLAIDLLVFFDVINVLGNSGNKYFICGIMGTIFLLFIVMGFYSLKSSKVWTIKANNEKNLIESLDKWCDENLNGVSIDNILNDELDNFKDLTEEAKYFSRAGKIKELILKEFVNLEDSFLEHYIDEYYPKLYELDS